MGVISDLENNKWKCKNCSKESVVSMDDDDDDYDNDKNNLQNKQQHPNQQQHQQLSPPQDQCNNCLLNYQNNSKMSTMWSFLNRTNSNSNNSSTTRSSSSSSSSCSSSRRSSINSSSTNNNNNSNCRQLLNLLLLNTNRRNSDSVFYKLIFVCWLMLNVNFIVFNSAIVSGDQRQDRPSVSGHYTPTWAVHIPNGGSETADQIAAEHGFINLGQILNGYYHFHHNTVSKRSIEPAHHHQKRLNDDDHVHWSKQQHAKSRQKRDYLRLKPRMSSTNMITLIDPKWPQMWYLNRGNGLDMNVIPAWRDGVTGKGVVVTILDDGLEYDHPDLIKNYDPKASTDVNSSDDDPMPHYDMTDSNRHGTRCAGEVAATANNSQCAVGIAFGARVGGVRMLDGDVTDAVEARSLSFSRNLIDIYSASWGPDDDGKTVDGPGELATRAFIEGVTQGRSGLGSIFIWASGNGGREHDNCNCDGYTNSIWTLSISSATEEGHVPWYSEKCSSTLATTYSSGGPTEKQIVTTDLHHSCTASHTGTSASAPLAAGIVALVLEANRNLTWRDLQHIVVRTAKPGNLKDSTWTKNAVGRRVSHSFGYGLMDAAAMVKLARVWKTVPEQQRCEINAPQLDKVIPPKSHIVLQLTVNHCKGVNYLEHVQAKITLASQLRGDIQIYLTSPAGTTVTLLTLRTHDVSRSGFNQWPFMSVHTWGEAPHGNWVLEIRNEGRFKGQAALKGWSLIFYGTTLPIDKNDPISIRLVQPNVNKYPVMVNSKHNENNTSSSGGGGGGGGGGSGNNGKNNRKQQQQYQKQNPINNNPLLPPRKNQKNFKKQNGGNGNGNGGGKSSKSQRTTTIRPYIGQKSTTLSDKNRKYDLNNFLSSYNRHTSTARPKLLMQPNNVDIYDKLPIKAPKDVKPENAPTLPSRNGGSNSGGSGHGNGLTKSVTKIITNPTTKSSIDSNGSTLYSMISAANVNIIEHSVATSNPNIPVLFQRYPKVQEIYPELQPYIPTPSPKLLNSGGGGGVDVSSGSAIIIAPAPPSSNGKPSRENSKNIYYTDSQYSSSQRVSSGGGGGGGGSSNSPIYSLAQHLHNSNSRLLTAQSNGKAQITQWDLVFHGTDFPSQPNDPPPPRPGIDNTYLSGEMDHNSLDFDSGLPNEQRREMQQIGEGHIDVQRTAKTNDQTGSACLNFAPNTKCLECHPNTFLYEGRCYTSCPERSYIVPEQPHIGGGGGGGSSGGGGGGSSNGDSNIAGSDDINRLSVLPLKKSSKSKSESLKRRRRRQNISNNINDKLASLFNDNDNDNNHSGFVRAVIMPKNQFSKLCDACHFSCLKCRGPNDYDCTACAPDAEYTEKSTNESYCSSPPTKTSTHSTASVKIMSNHLYVTLLIFIPTVTLIFVLLIASWILKWDLCWGKFNITGSNNGNSCSSGRINSNNSGNSNGGGSSSGCGSSKKSNYVYDKVNFEPTGNDDMFLDSSDDDDDDEDDEDDSDEFDVIKVEHQTSS